MSAPRQLTPHGQLIEQAREAARPRLSAREAARRAGISEGRWRQVVTGRQSVGGGQTIEISTKPATVAAMARAVGLDPRPVVEAAGFAYDPAEEVEPSVAEGDTAMEKIMRAPVDEETRALMVRFLQERRARNEEALELDLARMIELALGLHGKTG
ncbi:MULTISPECIES: helix-turn-helix domain-containing protein [Catenuloplanes]|uniref:Uncharacterized protein n=1 Tax=Catenuloplanes niger TaxID=587534 RepID=A0AAE4CTG8_9ACTN|nr:helix-turn-helix transcriptional regulator [Catenuloplanes niger]MDR7323412.1 hypothetical protein [Catenuloplanes niger]